MVSVILTVQDALMAGGGGQVDEPRPPTATPFGLPIPKRDGRATYSEPKTFQVSPNQNPSEWRFTAPTIE